MQEALLAAGLQFSAGRVLSGTVACTGNQGCRYAASDTKTHAVALAHTLGERFPQLTQPINLHVTGCINSCAQHYIGDIGLMGTKVEGEEGYVVSLGGGTDGDQGIAREFLPAIKYADLPPVMERLLGAFDTSRAPKPRRFSPSRAATRSKNCAASPRWRAYEHVPFIPENAPFNPAQRAWLNGFLAGLYSSAPGQAATSAVAFEPRNVAVLYASQTGTGERLAKKVAKELKAKGHTAKLSSLDAYPVHELSVEECAVIVASTYGEGDPPDGVKGFYDALCADTAPRLERLEYIVLALGDSHYEHFCKFGVDLDQRLEALGAKRTAPIVTRRRRRRRRALRALEVGPARTPGSLG